MLLQELNKHPRDKRIIFDEEPHIYYIDGKKADISVTTLIHKYFPHFDAVEISKKMVEKYSHQPDNKYFNKTASF